MKGDEMTEPGYLTTGWGGYPEGEEDAMPRIEETLLTAIEQIRRYASGEDQLADDREDEDAVLVRIDEICKPVLPVQRTRKDWDKLIEEWTPETARKQKGGTFGT